MKLPWRVATKGEANQLIEQLFPPQKDILRDARAQHPGEDPHLQFYWARVRIQHNLVCVMHWLMERDTRIYKRARGHLFDIMMTRIDTLMWELMWEWHKSLDKEMWQKQYNEKLSRQNMNGSGEGI